MSALTRTGKSCWTTVQTNIETYGVICMDQSMAHVDRTAPVYGGMCLIEDVGQLAGSFANDFERPDDHRLCSKALHFRFWTKARASEAAVTMSKIRASSRHIEKLCFGQDLVLSDVVPAAFNSSAINQIDAPTQDRLERLFQIEEVVNPRTW